MNEWNIQSRGRACEACGKSFADQETYHTLLFDERHDFRRQDVCAACFDSQFAGAKDRKGFISYWHGVFEAPKPTTEAIRKDTAESLLRKLIEQNDPKHIPAGYILAVMLERKRLLKVKEQLHRDGHRVFIYEQPGTGDIFTIVDPELQLTQLEEVQRDVAQLLEHGLNPPTETPAPAPTPEGAVEVSADVAAAAESAEPVAGETEVVSQSAPSTGKTG